MSLFAPRFLSISAILAVSLDLFSGGIFVQAQLEGQELMDQIASAVAGGSGQAALQKAAAEGNKGAEGSLAAQEVLEAQNKPQYTKEQIKEKIEGMEKIMAQKEANGTLSEEEKPQLEMLRKVMAEGQQNNYAGFSSQSKDEVNPEIIKHLKMCIQITEAAFRMKKGNWGTIARADLREMAENKNYSMEEQLASPFWRAVGVCIFEISEEDANETSPGSMVVRPLKQKYIKRSETEVGASIWKAIDDETLKLIRKVAIAINHVMDLDSDRPAPASVYIGFLMIVPLAFGGYLLTRVLKNHQKDLADKSYFKKKKESRSGSGSGKKSK